MSFVMSAMPAKAAVFTGARASARGSVRTVRAAAVPAVQIPGKSAVRMGISTIAAVARPAPVVQAKRGDAQVVTAGGGGPVVADTVPEDVRFDMTEGGQKKRWSMIFALFVIVAILWGMRLKRRRRAADQEIARNNAQLVSGDAHQSATPARQKPVSTPSPAPVPLTPAPPPLDEVEEPTMSKVRVRFLG